MLTYTYILKKFEKVRKCGKKKGEILKSCTQKLKIKADAKLTHSLLQNKNIKLIKKHIETMVLKPRPFIEPQEREVQDF